MGQRKRYSKAFKEDAVRLVRNRGTRTVKQIAAELGLSSTQLHRWNAALAREDAAEDPDDQTVDVEALRRRLRQVEQENALLKKAAALFARDVK